MDTPFERLTNRLRLCEVLHQLGLTPLHAGVALGQTAWSEDPAAKILELKDPATEEVIASVRLGTEAQYEAVVEEAQKAFHRWRVVPASKRAELVRQVGLSIEKKRDLLASLLVIETGKIWSEAVA